MIRSSHIALLGVALALSAAPRAAALSHPSRSIPTATPAELRTIAHDYYAWRDSIYPVGTSDAGNHRWDDRLTDYRLATVQSRRAHVHQLLDRVRAMRTTG